MKVDIKEDFGESQTKCSSSMPFGGFRTTRDGGEVVVRMLCRLTAKSTPRLKCFVFIYIRETIGCIYRRRVRNNIEPKPDIIQHRL